jgi:phage terminase large subunit-like protein
VNATLYSLIGRTSRLSRLHSNLESYISANIIEPVKLSDEDQLLKERCESSFYEFVKNAWLHVEGREFVDGWHVQAMCEHLQAVQQMEIRNLLCNLPFRVGKSMIFCVMFPAWCWAIEPGLRFLFTSYSEDLTVRDSVFCRRLIANNWYQKLWGDKFSVRRDVDNKHRFDNNKHGYRLSSSVGATVTGQGGDINIFDDPNNLQTVHSEIMRNRVSNFFDYVLSSRFTLASLARRIVVQQRADPSDLTAHILAKNDPSWVFLCLPMEFEPSRRSQTVPLPMSNGRVWTDPRKKEGELLWPQGIDHEALRIIKSNFNNDSYTISSQLQQSPFPVEGGLLQAEWFQKWTDPFYPEFEYILQSWDTALTTGKMSCYSACTTWGIFKNRKTGTKNIMLLSLFKEKLEYPDLRKAAIRLANNYEDVYFDEPINGHKPPHLILIEEKMNGYCILQDLMRANLPVMKFDPNKHGNKIGRCRIVSHLIENGLVWLPAEPPHYKYYTQDSEMFLEAAVNFPEDRSGKPTNDIIDSMSQAFIRLTSTGWISNTYDPVDEKENVWRNMQPKYGNSGNTWKMRM